MLSGFLITGILHDTKESAHRTRNFYARRSLRIFPLYYGLLIVVFAALPFVLPGTDPRLEQVESMRPWLFLYGTNIFVSIYDKWCILGHFWSLAVEEHFYLVWPLVVFGLLRKAAMRVCGLVVVAALACRLAFIARGFVLAPYCLTLCRMDSLVIGGFLALAARGEGGLAALAPLGRRVAIGSARSWCPGFLAGPGDGSPESGDRLPVTRPLLRVPPGPVDRRRPGFVPGHAVRSPCVTHVGTIQLWPLRI